MPQESQQRITGHENMVNMEMANELAPSFFQREERTKAHGERLSKHETEKQPENRK